MNSKQTQKFHEQSLIWDAHACFPLKPNADLSGLKRYKDSGVNFLSLNIGMDMDAFENVVQVLACYRKHIMEHPDDFVLAVSVNNIQKAKES